MIYQDIQSQIDTRGLAIEKVGISDLRYPIRVLDRAFDYQDTVAKISLSVDLPHDSRGTHMSRFLEVLNTHHRELTVRTIPIILGELQGKLAAASSHIDVRFPYFIQRRAPVSGATSWLDYGCRFTATLRDTLDFKLGIRVPVTTLCPCSKAISEYGAHNQRGFIQVEVRTVDERYVWIEELVETVESCGSAPIYPLLKRTDERFVTMQAYENPTFVEDVVRGTALLLRNDERFAWFRVKATNHESIHNHNAFAEISSKGL